jgi:TPP-dependent pyruvate/acetoin dehydrogenase alpha subunit
VFRQRNFAAHDFRAVSWQSERAERATDVQFHFADLEKGFVGPISHLGDMIPVMTGILLAARMKKENRVAVAYVGDGATSTGAFHEGVNFAAVQKLPLDYDYRKQRLRLFDADAQSNRRRANFVDKAVGYGILGCRLTATILSPVTKR